MSLVDPHPRTLRIAAAAFAVLLAAVAVEGYRTSTPLFDARALLARQLDTVAEVELPSRAGHGPVLGRFQLTYYWLAAETRSPGDDALVDLKSKSCKTIARVAAQFERNVRMEGSGVLRDGRVITMAGRCDCGAPCYRIGQHAFGTGASARALSPFRSVAVDPRLVQLGSKLYIPELDGLTMPGPAPWGGFVHDGCVMADDRGGGVKGRQLDLFTVKKTHYASLSRRLGLRRVTVMDGADRCVAEPPRITAAARRGGV